MSKSTKMQQFQPADVEINLKEQCAWFLLLVHTREILCRQQALVHVVLVEQSLLLCRQVGFKEILTRGPDLWRALPVSARKENLCRAFHCRLWWIQKKQIERNWFNQRTEESTQSRGVECLEQVSRGCATLTPFICFLVKSCQTCPLSSRKLFTLPQSALSIFPPAHCDASKCSQLNKDCISL